MKKATIAGIVIGVLALGGVSGGFLLSNMAEQAIRDKIASLPDSFPNYQQATCDDVQVSLPTFSVRISNLKLVEPEAEVTYKDVVVYPRPGAALAALPFLRSAMLPASGSVTLGDVDARDISVHTQMDDGTPLAFELKSIAAEDVYFDAAFYRSLLDGQKLTFQDSLGKTGVVRLDAEQVRSLQQSSLDISLDALHVQEVVAGSSIGSLDMKKLRIASSRENLDCALLRLTDIRIPPALANAAASGKLLKPAEVQRILGSSAPLFRTLLLEGLSLASSGDLIETRRTSLDWRSTTPLHTITSIEQLTLPSSLLQSKGLPAIPGLANLVIDFNWEHLEQGKTFLEKNSLNIADMGRFDTELEHSIDISSLDPSNPLGILGAQFQKASLSYEDKGGLARLLALQIRNEAALSQIDMLASQLPAAIPGQANRPLVEALHTMLITPGTLNLRLRDGMELTAFEMLVDVSALGRKCDVSVVPGKENIKDQLRRLFVQ